MKLWKGEMSQWGKIWERGNRRRPKEKEYRISEKLFSLLWASEGKGATIES